MVEVRSTPQKEITCPPEKGPFQKEKSLPSCMLYVSFRGSKTCVLHQFPLRTKRVGDVDQLPIVRNLCNLCDEGPIEWFPSQRKKEVFKRDKNNKYNFHEAAWQGKPSRKKKIKKIYCRPLSLANEGAIRSVGFSKPEKEQQAINMHPNLCPEEYIPLSEVTLDLEKNWEKFA